MSTNEGVKYFDLHTNGLGYMSRVREVTPSEGEPFLAVTLAALRGNAEEAQYTYFECRVSGKQAQHVVRQLKTDVKAEKKVLTKHPDNPKPVEETIVVKEQVTLKIIKLEEKNIYWKK